VRLWNALRCRIRSLMFRDRRESELREELQLHLEREIERLQAAGVVFTKMPTQMGPVSIAVCADTCGNLIQLYQPPPH